MDDGSTDGTREILRELANREPRIKAIERGHAGVAAAANAGAAAAGGEFLARMDADDISHPERLAEQVAFLDAATNRDIGVVGCLVEFGGDRAVGEGYARHVDWVNSLVTPEEIALNRFVESPLANPSVMFRRDLIERHGGYRDGDFPEDYELWLRWLDAGVRMAKVPRVLLTWNDSPTRFTRTDTRYDPEAFFRVKATWIAKQVAELVRVWPENARTSQTLTRSATREIWVWGAGRPARKRAAHLTAHGVRIAGYIDVDAKKTGRGIGGTGLPVIAPEALPPPDGFEGGGKVFVLGYVAKRGVREDIRARLCARGYIEGRDFLMCA